MNMFMMSIMIATSVLMVRYWNTQQQTVTDTENTKAKGISVQTVHILANAQRAKNM